MISRWYEDRLAEDPTGDYHMEKSTIRRALHNLESLQMEGLLLMDYLPSSSVIRNNDQVVTSGSTVYPRNLILGYVVDAGFDDTGVAKYALVEPAVDVRSLEQVFIVTEYNAG